MLKFSSPKHLLLVLTLGLTVWSASCSRRSDQIYDTAGNPDRFPQMAVDMVRDIQSGGLAGGAAITDAFGELYTEHPELLDYPGWTEVIKRLGGHFAKTGDSLTTGSVAGYTLAAEYYQLASFALPTDPDIRDKAAAFECWHRVALAAEASLEPLTAGSTDPAEVLGALRPLALADNVSYKFVRTYLTEPLRDRLSKAGQLKPDAIDRLSDADRALAAFCGLVALPPSEPVAQFVYPQIDVVAARVRQTGDGRYSAEAYFIPHIDAPRRLTFGLELFTPDSTMVPVELVAAVPREQWKAGELAAVGREFRFEQELAAAALALLDATEEPPHLVEIRDRADAMWPLPIDTSLPESN